MEWWFQALFGLCACPLDALVGGRGLRLGKHTELSQREKPSGFECTTEHSVTVGGEVIVRNLGPHFVHGRRISDVCDILRVHGWLDTHAFRLW